MTRGAGVAALLALSMIGCPWGTITPEEFEAEFGVAPSAGARAEKNVFAKAGLAGCVTAFRAAVGEEDIHALSLDLYPTYAYLKARSPNKRANVDEYQCRYGQVEPSKPVKLSESEEKELDAKTFTFSQLDLDVVPDRIAAAVPALGLDDGKVSNVLVRVVGPSTDLELEVSVNLTGSRKNGSIQYDGKGAEVSRNQVKPQKDVLGADLEDAFSSLKAKLGPGPIKVATFTLFEHWALFSVESPPGSGKLADIAYEHGKVSPRGSSSPAYDGRHLFDLDRVPLDVLRKILSDTGAPSGAVTHVIVGVGSGPRDTDPTLRVYTKASGYPTYDLKGKLLRR